MASILALPVIATVGMLVIWAVGFLKLVRDHRHAAYMDRLHREPSSYCDPALRHLPRQNGHADGVQSAGGEDGLPEMWPDESRLG